MGTSVRPAKTSPGAWDAFADGRWCTRPVQGWWDALPSLVLIIPMPHKHNAARRHHIPKMSFEVQNWPASKRACAGAAA
jgi:hypothetical protein